MLDKWGPGTQMLLYALIFRRWKRWSFAGVCWRTWIKAFSDCVVCVPMCL